MDKKVILITGASSGIGAVTATYLASLGHIVYGAARRLDRLEALAGVKPVQLDVSNESQVKTAVQDILRTEGHIDVLVNNAGYGEYGPIEEIPLDDARKQFEVNVFGLASITKEVIPSMKSRKQGRIINISSVGGVISAPLGGWYHASKFALEGWSDCLRMELFPFNIPVIVVQPGIIKTEFGDVMNETGDRPLKEKVYADMRDVMKKFLAESDKQAADPMVIAKVIAHGSFSKNPKTRYVAGGMAKPMMFVRKFLNDKKWTLMMLKQFGFKGKKKYDL